MEISFDPFTVGIIFYIIISYIIGFFLIRGEFKKAQHIISEQEKTNNGFLWFISPAWVGIFFPIIVISKLFYFLGHVVTRR